MLPHPPAEPRGPCRASGDLAGVQHERSCGERVVVGVAVSELGGDPLDERGVESSGEHLGIGEQQSEELDVRRDAERHGLGERAAQQADRPGAVGRPRDDLREHRVVVGGDAGPLGERCVDADPLTGRQRDGCEGAARREETCPRILCVHTRLDRVPLQRDVVLRHAERSPRCDAKLRGDEIHTGDLLGHRVFDLESCVHLR